MHTTIVSTNLEAAIDANSGLQATTVIWDAKTAFCQDRVDEHALALGSGEGIWEALETGRLALDEYRGY